MNGKPNFFERKRGMRCNNEILALEKLAEHIVAIGIAGCGFNNIYSIACESGFE